MSLFRSEGHADRWIAGQGRARGAIVPLKTVWHLAQAWYADPRAPDWRPRTREESQAVLSSVGLRDDFWTLP